MENQLISKMTSTSSMFDHYHRTFYKGKSPVCEINCIYIKRTCNCILTISSPSFHIARFFTRESLHKFRDSLNLGIVTDDWLTVLRIEHTDHLIIDRVYTGITDEGIDIFGNTLAEMLDGVIETIDTTKEYDKHELSVFNKIGIGILEYVCTYLVKRFLKG